MDTSKTHCPLRLALYSLIPFAIVILGHLIPMESGPYKMVMILGIVSYFLVSLVYCIWIDEVFSHPETKRDMKILAIFHPVIAVAILQERLTNEEEA